MSSAIQVAKTATYLPDLVEVQRASFKWFLEKGLIEELESFSPITDYTGKLELHFIGSEYRLKRPRHDVEEAKRRDATFASQMYVTCRLVNKETGEIKEQEVFRGTAPDDRARHLHHQWRRARDRQPDRAFPRRLFQRRAGQERPQDL